jgi:hypothetical protein
MLVTEEPTPEEVEASLITFAEETLGLSLYDWQVDAIEPFDHASERMVQVTLSTPNGSGKSAVVIPTLGLGWLALYPRGKVVITTADGKQLDGQVMPAIEAYREKFPDWKFNEREITTPSRGRLVAFTTDQAGRAEGWHKIDDLDGPLLIIADEAKTIPDDIFSAIDRCTYNALLLTSSPGRMNGRFYDSHFNEALHYVRIRVGLKDCPHITQDKIDRIIAQHGEDSAFTRSTLHGEFMQAEGEARFDRDGLAILKVQAEAGARTALIGSLDKGSATSAIQFTRGTEAGWLWLDEAPVIGGEYLIAVDPNTCEQGEGAKDRDNTAAPVIRKGYIDERGVEHPDHIVAALHWPGGVKWDSDVLAGRIALLSEWYGHCMAVVEANNFGSALIKELQHRGVRLWRRTRVDDVNPNKEIRTVGWLTTNRTREHWVQACTKAIRCNEDEQGHRSIALRCRYQPAVNEFHSFIFTSDGRGEAQAGTHDDWVAAIGIGLAVRCFTRMLEPRVGVMGGEAYGRGALGTGLNRGGWE